MKAEGEGVGASVGSVVNVGSLVDVGVSGLGAGVKEGVGGGDGLQEMSCVGNSVLATEDEAMVGAEVGKKEAVQSQPHFSKSNWKPAWL